MNSGRLEVTDTSNNSSAGKAGAVPAVKKNVDRRAGKGVAQRNGRKSVPEVAEDSDVRCKTSKPKNA